MHNHGHVIKKTIITLGIYKITSWPSKIYKNIIIKIGDAISEEVRYKHCDTIISYIKTEENAQTCIT